MLCLHEARGQAPRASEAPGPAPADSLVRTSDGRVRVFDELVAREALHDAALPHGGVPEKHHLGRKRAPRGGKARRHRSPAEVPSKPLPRTPQTGRVSSGPPRSSALQPRRHTAPDRLPTASLPAPLPSVVAAAASSFSSSMDRDAFLEFERLATASLSGTNTAATAEAQRRLAVVGESLEYVDQLQFVLDNTENPYAVVVAVTSLRKLVTEHWTSFEVKERLQIRASPARPNPQPRDLHPHSFCAGVSRGAPGRARPAAASPRELAVARRPLTFRVAPHDDRARARRRGAGALSLRGRGGMTCARVRAVSRGGPAASARRAGACADAGVVAVARRRLSRVGPCLTVRCFRSRARAPRQGTTCWDTWRAGARSWTGTRRGA